MVNTVKSFRKTSQFDKYHLKICTAIIIINGERLNALRL